MGHLPKLIEDLALILIVGAVVTLLFRRIKQPLVLGYIIAGLFVGPHLDLMPTVADKDNVKTLAEIGVIFLLFSLGLEFSFKKLMRVGGAASITAFFEIVFITVVGFLAGKWMGWSVMDSMFLGGMLASSSTTIIIRAFDELGVKTKKYARVVFGVLVVEDIVVILLMVLLSTVAVTQTFEGMEMLKTVGKLLFFLILWFIAGIFIIPSFLRAVKKMLDEETLLILAIGLCLGMVVLATQVGFSAELGAFIMGSILAESTKAEKIEHIIKPVKDLFGAVFFVSVGMMIDPKAIADNAFPVFIVTFITIFGKFISTTIGAVISGQPLKQSIQVGMSMAQIGEFAFIVASLGLSLGVISEFLFPVAVGASAITTFTTPYMIKYSDRVFAFTEKILPAKVLNAINKYSYSAETIQTESNWKKVIKSYSITVLTNFIMILALSLLAVMFLHPFIGEQFENPKLANIIALIITFIVITPFMWGLMAKKPNNMAYKELWINNKYNKGPLLAMEFIRVGIGVLIIGFLVSQFYTPWVAIIVAILFTAVILFIFSKKVQSLYARLETRFLDNLNARENDKELLRMEASKVLSESHLKIKENEFKKHLALSPWDVHIVDLIVSPNALYKGSTLLELSWRERYGINIAYIKRGDKVIYAPSAYNRLFPFDEVGIIATDEQIQQFKPVFETSENLKDGDDKLENVAISKVVVNQLNKFKGLTIKESKIKEATNGLVLGIERGNDRILSPGSDTILEWGDIIWIVGDKSLISKLNKNVAVT
ncbi:cation:proton antiporter domain-containing protein [Polluticaenibacter yanchengensis]|uniref:Cation:proton antiporter n=1 Tax=Polluticaenibacter yanchengensis TaxID=3014562 RepID=A0ABT4UIP2_9BACT|nr:cation:proton antiporter [Chitinophagaceae bacterium LY-5]